jgi:hypothetical protein
MILSSKFEIEIRGISGKIIKFGFEEARRVEA